MRDQERLTRPVVVSLPAEIDIANAEHVGEQLRAAFAPECYHRYHRNRVDGLCCTSGGCQPAAVHKG
jgi:hypothetical protein